MPPYELLGHLDRGGKYNGTEVFIGVALSRPAALRVLNHFADSTREAAALEAGTCSGNRRSLDLRWPANTYRAARRLIEHLRHRDAEGVGDAYERPHGHVLRARLNHLDVPRRHLEPLGELLLGKG